MLAQRKRAGLITRRTLDRNQDMLLFLFGLLVKGELKMKPKFLLWYKQLSFQPVYLNT